MMLSPNELTLCPESVKFHLQQSIHDNGDCHLVRAPLFFVRNLLVQKELALDDPLETHPLFQSLVYAYLLNLDATRIAPVFC